MANKIEYTKREPGCETGYTMDEANEKLEQVKLLLRGQPYYNSFSIEEDEEHGGFKVVAEAMIKKHENTLDNDDGIEL